LKRLTPFQEREIAMRLDEGLTYEQIATRLSRALGTVNNDFYHIHKALGCKHTCELPVAFKRYRVEHPERLRHFVK
jgi:DNA-binding NarL/FixJ family response regulator